MESTEGKVLEEGSFTWTWKTNCSSGAWRRVL